MGPHWQWCILSLSLFSNFLQVLSHGTVFRRAPQAQKVFLRPKRANSFFVEEMLQGHLERECFEERCSYEEAREYFEDTPKTNSFWTVYYDGDQCDPNPCLHGTNCTDRVGGYLCNCTKPYYGLNCELGTAEVHVSRPPTSPQLSIPDISECPTDGPKACQHFCTASFGAFHCSCATGYKLHKDGRSCVPEVRHPCGKVSLPMTGSLNLTDTASRICPDGHCPWQVSVVDSHGEELCGGVILGKRSVLTSAQCLFMGRGPHVQPSNFHIHTGHKTKAVKAFTQAMYIHSRYKRDRHDDDLVLLQLTRPLPFGSDLFQLCLPTKDFSENVLMRPGRPGLTSHNLGENGNSVHQYLAYMSLEDCRNQLNISHPLSNKMFCMKSWGAGKRQSAQQQQIALETRNEEERGSGRQIHKGTNDQQRGSESQNGTQIQNGRRNFTDTDVSFRSGKSRSKSVDSGCGLLPGTPMTTELRGTVFLTGVQLSPSSSDCDDGGGGGRRGLVFTKLSRYLPWIQQRLDLAEEAEMIPQVSEYPPYL